MSKDSAERKAELKALEQTPLFQALPRHHRGRIAELAAFMHYHDDDVIVREGEPGDSFHIIVAGDALAVTSSGRETLLTSADCFGELSLIDGAPRAATVKAVGPVTTACIGRADFGTALHDEPALAVGLLPGLTLVVRDLQRLDSQRIPDHSGPRDEGAGPAVEAVPEELEGRDALGWLVVLRHVGLFEALAESHLRRIARFVTVERYAGGSTVVLAGEPGDSLFIILNGRARVRTPGGHTRALGADDCFGELALIDGAPRSATVTAVGDLTTAKLTRADFEKLLKAEPAVAVGLLDGLVGTIRDLQQAAPPVA
jgi:CRP-like cAMP-binding protein